MIRAALSALTALLVSAAALAAPTEEMFEKLLAAETDKDAEKVANDIWASWYDSGSGVVDLLMERALEASQYGRKDLARELYDRVIFVNPEYAEAWNRRATLFLEAEDYEQALRDINETIRLEPRHFGAWTVLGQVLESVGASREALEAYREALKIHPRLDIARQAERRLQNGPGGRSL